MEDLKFLFNYNQYKFTNQIFYRNIQSAKAEVYFEKFVVEIYPYFNYSGTYHILDSRLHDNGILYTVAKEHNGEINFDFLNQIFIYLSEDGRQLKIFDGNLVGIILKF